MMSSNQDGNFSTEDTLSASINHVDSNTKEPKILNSYAPKRRRSDHNEVERKRREVQRDRINELGNILPGKHNIRSSTVAVVTRAREYIEALRTRITELESIISVMSPQHLPPQSQQNSPRIQQSPTIIKTEEAQTLKLPIKSHIRSNYSASPTKNVVKRSNPKNNVMFFDEEKVKSQICEYFRVHRLSSSGTISGPASLPHKASNPTLEVIPEDSLQLMTHILDTNNESKRDSTTSESLKLSDEELKNSFLHRRHSSLLFSSLGGVFWNRRQSQIDAISNPFLPVLETLQMDIRCGKCQRGVDNLIMIDCDKCKSWFHLRCVNVDPTHVPISWTCPEC